MHLAQFHPVHSVHSEGEIFVKAAPSHYATSLCPCHYVGTLVPPQWHDCDMPLAQLCQQGGTSMALYRLFQRSCRERFNVNRNYTPQQHEQLYASKVSNVVFSISSENSSPRQDSSHLNEATDSEAPIKVKSGRSL